MWSAKFSLELCPTVMLKTVKINAENYKILKVIKIQKLCGMGSSGKGPRTIPSARRLQMSRVM